jgi:predicted esterase
MPIAARGIYRGVDNIGRTWFGGTLASPEPASFGDSLAQLERIVYDDRQRSEQWSAQCPWIVGVGQGAVLALALALTLPEFVSGVVAVGGALPRFRDATLLEGRPMNMPILMLSPSLDGSVSPEHQQESLQRLQSLGADVRSVELELAAVLGESAATILRDWWTSHSFT